MNVIIDSSKIFTDGWSVYQKILNKNYMFHQEIYSKVSDFVKQYFKHKNISILDLGCGDASQITKAFNGVNVAGYFGCDLSNEALKSAKTNLVSLTSNIELVCEDMLETLEKTQKKFDVIFTSYAVHHLNQEQKRLFFSFAKDLLVDDGCLLMIDVTRAVDETHDQYLDHYLNHVKLYWDVLDDQEFKLINNHVRSSDFPETLVGYEKLANEVGFKSCEVLAKHTWHYGYCFFKA
jgi:cyclopropane fatty-acyl-phospholipid synthase-like methyltransferase